MKNFELELRTKLQELRRTANVLDILIDGSPSDQHREAMHEISQLLIDRIDTILEDNHIRLITLSNDN